MNVKILKIHERNLNLFSTYRDLEGELIDSLQEFDLNQGHKKMGYRSLFSYCIENIKMTENQAFTLIRVSRKSLEVPELKEAVKRKEISLSSAKVIAPILNKENQSIWIEKAKVLPKPQLERELVRVNPKLIKNDRILPLTSELSEARGTLSKEALKILERVKEIESKRLSGPCDLDKAILAMGKLYLSKNDPVVKAERIVGSTKQGPLSGEVKGKPLRVKRAIPKRVLHEVNLRDKGQCQVVHKGKVCLSKYFPDTHHVKLFSNGGSHTLDNLITVCRGHHQSLHAGAKLEFNRTTVPEVH